MTIIIAIIIFMFLILIHEFGHFLVAKASGVKVNEFSIGMGPAIFSREKGETIYSLRILPLGGYCAMEGEDEDSDDPGSFDKASPYKRLLILIAGAGFNFLSALIVLMIINFIQGVPVNQVGDFTENSPAQIAGLEIEDEIISVNGKDVKKWNDISNILADAENGDVLVKVSRKGQEMDFDIRAIKEGGRYMIGIYPLYQKSFLFSIGASFSQFFALFATMFQTIGMLFSGQAGIKDLAGPIGVVGMIGTAVDSGLINVLGFFSYIAINLGFVNLLPIPALDGGRVIMTLIEIIRGKALPKKMEGMINLIGLSLLLVLIVVVSFNDVSRLMR